MVSGESVFHSGDQQVQNSLEKCVPGKLKE